jgi:hypothetical protein
MRDAFHCRSGRPIIHIVQGLLATVIIRWSSPLLHNSLHILLKGWPADLRGHFEIGHTNFRPEWR